MPKLIVEILQTLTFKHNATLCVLIEYSINTTDAITPKMSVFVKCRYSASLTVLRRRRSVRVVCTSDVKIHQHIAESSTASGMLATRILLDGSFCVFFSRR